MGRGGGGGCDSREKQISGGGGVGISGGWRGGNLDIICKRDPIFTNDLPDLTIK